MPLNREQVCSFREEGILVAGGIRWIEALETSQRIKCHRV